MIQFVDLKSLHDEIFDEMMTSIGRVIRNCQFTLGPDVQAFEEEFASYCESASGVAVNSGTSALHVAMLAAGIGPGDEVITTPFTFMATVSAIAYTGAKPVFVDIDPTSFTIDPNLIEAAITKQTKAIVPVHLYGQPADMDQIMAIARRHGLIVIEDAAQAHGALYRGRKVGSLGDLGCFSFYPGKNLGAVGEGGMVVSSNPEFVRTMRMYRDWGAEKKYHHVLKGYNYRMEGVQGAVLRIKLKHLDKWTRLRRDAAAHYDELFADSPVNFPVEKPYSRHVYHVYAIRTPDRERWQAELSSRDIQTGIHYPYPVHLLPAFSDLGHSRGDFEHSEKAASEVLSLPMHPMLTEGERVTVAEAVRSLAQAPHTRSIEMAVG